MTTIHQPKVTLHQIEKIITILQQKNGSGQFDNVLAAYLDLRDFLQHLIKTGKNDG